jgi:hypothetical protein
MPSGIEINKELARRYERWLTVQHYSASTRYVYARIVRRFSEFMGRTIVTRANQPPAKSIECRPVIRFRQDQPAAGIIAKMLM